MCNLLFDSVTNSSGLTNTIEVEAPPIDYSQNPSDNSPYSLYDIRVEKAGFEEVLIENVQVFPERTALQNDFTLQIQLQRQMDFPARLESKL